MRNRRLASLILSFALAASARAELPDPSALLRERLAERGTLVGTRVDASAPETLEDARALCEVLTNKDVKVYRGVVLPERKGIFKKHVHRICEEIELSVALGGGIAPELRQELALLRYAFLGKASADAGVGLLDILEFGATTALSPLFLGVDPPAGEPSAALPSDPPASIFWADAKGPAARFDELAADVGVKSVPKVLVLDHVGEAGSAPKIHAKTTDGKYKWMLKLGDKVHTDTLTSRIFAALGYFVDYPYFRKSDEMVLVLGKNKSRIKSARDLAVMMDLTYRVNISAFIKEAGPITDAMAASSPELKPYIGRTYVRFVESALEVRFATVERLGGRLELFGENSDRRELRGLLLAHAWVGMWDTKEDNLSLVVQDNGGKKHLRGILSDLGSSLGVRIHQIPRDFKVGLVNDFPWHAIRTCPPVPGFAKNRICLNSRVNVFLRAYRRATFDDLRWMATKIARIDGPTLRKFIAESGWPDAVAELYYAKLMNRRAEILRAFSVPDPAPVSIAVNEDAKIDDVYFEDHPEGLVNGYGRFRNYGR